MKNPNEDRRTGIIMAVLGVIPVTWAALMVAPFLSQGLAGIVTGFTTGMNDPMKITWCADSMKAILIFLAIYGMSVGVYLSTRRNYRRGEEHGSAKWGDARQLCKKYADKDKQQNIILTQNTRIGLDGRKHRRNLNVMVVGGSGAGKTRFFAKPNIMQANTSFVVLDPKGEILRDTGGLLEKQGYDIKVLDLINTEKSHGFNPFVYLRDDKDVLRLVSNLIRNTTPKGAQSNDPFWERAETALLEALILYLVNEAPPEEKNFPMVMEMINAAEVKEEDEEYASVLDELFERLAMNDPEHLAVKQYHIFKLAAGKTAKSILISLGVRLEKFNLPQIASVVNHDELDIPSLGERKTALFAIILSFCPKFAALIVAMPAATMGGVSLVLYGMISAVGVRNVVENNVDFTKSRNVLVAAMIMGLAVGVTYNGAIVIPVGGVTISLSGLAVAALVGILMNAVLPGKDYEFGTNEQGDTSVNFGTRAE